MRLAVFDLVVLALAAAATPSRAVRIAFLGARPRPPPSFGSSRVVPPFLVRARLFSRQPTS
jgi:hypothetical protein|eukprot:31482-Pelagococcus_subviridis.AAC.13